MTKETDKIKVPTRTSTSRVEKALKNIPLDGQWHELLEMGFTVAEQPPEATTYQEEVLNSATHTETTQPVN